MITVASNVTKIAVEVSGFPETVVTVTPVVQPVTVTPVFTAPYRGPAISETEPSNPNAGDIWLDTDAPVISETEPTNPNIGDIWLDTDVPNISVGSTEPTSPNVNDIWIQT